MTLKEGKKVLENATADDLYEEIKKNPLFEMYKDGLSENPETSIEILGSIMLLHGIANKEFGLKLDYISKRFFFSILDQRYRAEYLGGKSDAGTD